MNRDNYASYIEFYKITRTSIEHFDKILGDFRKIIFTFNGVVISAGVACYIKTVNINYVTLFWANLMFACTNLLVWQLEKHYHRYLTMSSKIAEQIEKLIFDRAHELNVALTFQLKEARNAIFGDNGDERIPLSVRKKLYKISRYLRTYDFLYLFPIVGSMFFSIFLAYKIGIKNNYKVWCDNYYMLASILVVISVSYITYIIIRSIYWFTKRYKGTEFTG